MNISQYVSYYPTVINPLPMARFMQRCSTGRADIAVIGDSNTYITDAYDTANKPSGWVHSLTDVWGQHFGLYAWQLTTVADTTWNGSPGASGPYFVKPGTATRNVFDSGVSVNISKYMITGGGWLTTSGFAKLTGDTSLTRATSNICYIQVRTTNPLNTANPRINLTCGMMTGASQPITGWIRRESPNWVGTDALNTFTVPAAGTATPAGTPSTLYDTYMDFNSLLGIDQGVYLCREGGSVAGEFAMLYQRLEDKNATKGVSVSCLLYQGGLTTRDAALALQGMTQFQLGEYYRQLTRLQNVSTEDAMLCIVIRQGNNDRQSGSNLPSVGTSVGATHMPTNTVQGFYENLSEVMRQCQVKWNAAGFTPNNLFFMISGGHPVTPAMRSYDVATQELSIRNIVNEFQNATIVRWSDIATIADIDAVNGYFYGNSNGAADYHLSYTGNMLMDSRTLTALLSASDFPGGSWSGGLRNRLSF